MPSNEDLYREIQSQEEEDDMRFRQNQAPKELKKLPRKDVDYNAAVERFKRDFAPVFKRRELARTSVAYRLWLKATGQWKDLDGAKVVDPSKGLVLEGPDVDAMQKEIAANPDAFRHLAKTAPKVMSVQAEHRRIEPMLGDEPKDAA